MPSIAEDLLYTTARLEGITPSGVSVGTGFYFAHNQRIFLVTNKHVVRDVSDGHFLITSAQGDGEKKTPCLGQGFRVPFCSENFIGHPDDEVDIAAMNLSAVITQLSGQSQQVYWKNISAESIPTTEIINKFIGPVEDVLFVGYPNGIWDNTNLLPIARQGITATPYYVDFQGRKQFLIDASVFPGSSGSPVFLYYAGSYADKDGELYAGNLVQFLGIVSSVYYRSERGELHAEEIPVQQRHFSQVQQMIDLGVVFKAAAVVETVQHYLRIAATHKF